MQIQVIDHPDAAAEQAVRQFLAEAGEAVGACGEHDPAWLRVLSDGLGHQPLMLVARDEMDRVVGYLPLALVATRLFGRFLVSLPYLNRAGIAATCQVAAKGLVDRAIELAKTHDVDYLELRHHDNALEHDDFNNQRDEKVRMVLDLPATADALWDSIKAKVRNQIRKGDKHELSIRWGGRETLDDFYSVFAVNMRDLGTPVYGRRFFSSMLKHLDDKAEFCAVNYQGEPIAAALLIHDGRSTQVPSASSLREHNATCANMWMYHQLLCRAIEKGSTQFDFGRSSEDSGTYRFKKQWGAEPHPTVWQYHVRRGDINAVRPDSPKYKRRIEMWQKMPVWLTRLVGPAIVRGIP